MTPIILIFHIAVSLLLIFLVLLMFGGGSRGGSMAVATAVERNLDRITVSTAVTFGFTTILLGMRVG